MDRAKTAGRMLAGRHGTEIEADPVHSVVNFAESPRTDDWTLRSALVRFAQPEPTRAGAVLELVRRTGSALHAAASTIERHTVACTPSLTLDRLLEDGDGDPLETYPDGRVTDLARLCVSAPDEAESLVAGYRAEIELEAAELDALRILPATLRLSELGDVLATWAAGTDPDPPVAVVDEVCHTVFTLLAELGVPRETGPPGRGR